MLSGLHWLSGWRLTACVGPRNRTTLKALYTSENRAKILFKARVNFCFLKRSICTSLQDKPALSGRNRSFSLWVSTCSENQCARLGSFPVTARNYMIVADRQTGCKASKEMAGIRISLSPSVVSQSQPRRNLRRCRGQWILLLLSRTWLLFDRTRPVTGSHATEMRAYFLYFGKFYPR